MNKTRCTFFLEIKKKSNTSMYCTYNSDAAEHPSFGVFCQMMSARKFVKTLDGK